MWCVRTASRLHLGLLSLPHPDESAWPDRNGQPVLPVRHFGGAGLMIDSPAIVLRAYPANSWSAEGPHAQRSLAFARLVADAIQRDTESTAVDLPPFRLLIEHAPREHVGLGVGTQLALAVARVLTRSWGRSDPPERLAQWTGRGQRSALGVHGFEQGGFLVEAGKRSGQVLSPLVARCAFPADWRILFIIPANVHGLAGPGEQAAFTRLHMSPSTCAELSRLVLLGILPGLAERDLKVFGEAVHDFNARVGEVFASVQGGTYSSPIVTELVTWLRRQGVAGVGQSSWGPGVFAFLANEDQAHHFAVRLRDFLPADQAEIIVSCGQNHGATEEVLP